jgi:Bsp6I restriction endonuclease.
MGNTPLGKLMIKKIEQMNLINIDALRIKTTIDIYFEWKQLDAKVRTLSTRGLNFPSELSENFACYALGYMLNKGKGGDAYDSKRKRIIEMKASSSERDSAPSSFSPKEEFDELVFIKLNREEDAVYIYLTGHSSEDIKQIEVNKNETLEQQQAKGRRPRFSIIDKIIKPLGLTPDVKFDMREKTVQKLK